MKSMNFRDDIPRVPIDKVKDYSLLVFDLTSMQFTTEICIHPERVEEKLRPQLKFTVHLEHVTELIVLAERMSPVLKDRFCVVRNIIQTRHRLYLAKFQVYSSNQVSVQ